MPTDTGWPKAPLDNANRYVARMELRMSGKDAASSDRFHNSRSLSPHLVLELHTPRPPCLRSLREIVKKPTRIIHRFTNEAETPDASAFVCRYRSRKLPRSGLRARLDQSH